MTLQLGNADLARILEEGAYLVLRNEAGIRDAWRTIDGVVREETARLCGAEAASRFGQDGLGALHEVLPAAQIGALRDAVMPRVRDLLFATTARVAREVLGIEDEFYVDDYTILRVNLPFEVALNAPKEAENPGIGRVAESTKAAARAAKVIDPVYDPRGYHQDQPPASWAHGPHLDTWTGHSRDGVNLWWAISDVPEENAMFFYPELFGRKLISDPRSLYLAAGQQLPAPTRMPLAPGEMLVFNPEVLHGTHLNVSGRTRIAVSTRINPRAPTFDPACFYAREFWHRGTAIEGGVTDDVVRLARDEHLGPALPPAEGPPLPTGEPVTVRTELSAQNWTSICDEDNVEPGGALIIESGEAPGAAHPNRRRLACRQRPLPAPRHPLDRWLPRPRLDHVSLPRAAVLAADGAFAEPDPLARGRAGPSPGRHRRGATGIDGPRPGHPGPGTTCSGIVAGTEPLAANHSSFSLTSSHCSTTAPQASGTCTAHRNWTLSPGRVSEGVANRWAPASWGRPSGPIKRQTRLMIGHCWGTPSWVDHRSPPVLRAFTRTVTTLPATAAAGASTTVSAPPHGAVRGRRSRSMTSPSTIVPCADGPSGSAGTAPCSSRRVATPSSAP